MRTTIRLDDALLAETKALAARSGRTLTAVIEEALRTLLARLDEPRSREPVVLPTAGGEGLQPGVDLDDTAALVERMDGVDGSP